MVYYSKAFIQFCSFEINIIFNILLRLAMATRGFTVNPN